MTGASGAGMRPLTGASGAGYRPMTGASGADFRPMTGASRPMTGQEGGPYIGTEHEGELPMIQEEEGEPMDPEDVSQP